ncbi:MAG: hypothetical protein H7Y31_05295 [Chitinophagaceae bacterium]|nr:hypothetical protein [Chitinophagaceae bacterium]
MLKEIFQKIASETENYLLLKGLGTKVKIGDSALRSSSKNMIILAMQDYGIDPMLKNHPPPIDGDRSGPNYAHLLSFYLLPVSEKYENRLDLLEAIVELFEAKPFFQLEINDEEYELSISMKTSSAADYQQFWLAREQASQPVVFYQARVSSL